MLFLDPSAQVLVGVNQPHTMLSLGGRRGWLLRSKQDGGLMNLCWLALQSKLKSYGFMLNGNSWSCMAMSDFLLSYYQQTLNNILYVQISKCAKLEAIISQIVWIFESRQIFETDDQPHNCFVHTYFLCALFCMQRKAINLLISINWNSRISCVTVNSFDPALGWCDRVRYNIY